MATPSCSASSTSQGEAGISSRVSRQMRVTSPPLAPGGAGHVHGHVAAADDQHLFALPKSNFWPEAESFRYSTPHSTPWASDPGTGRRMESWAPTPEEDGAETVPGEEVVDGAVAADGGVVVNLHPAALDVIHFLLQDLPGQAILRDAVAQPAAGFRGGLEDHRLVALEGQMVGAAQTRGTGADDGHGLAFLGRTPAPAGRSSPRCPPQTASGCRWRWAHPLPGGGSRSRRGGGRCGRWSPAGAAGP